MKTNNKNRNQQTASNLALIAGFAPGIGARIRLLADRMGSRANAALAAGVSEDMVYRYMRGDSLPSFGAMASLAHAAGASLEWLATGNGPMMQADSKKEAYHAALGGEFVLLPRYNGGDGIGAAECVLEYWKLAFHRELLCQKGLSENDLVVICVTGDAMSPIIRNDALAVVDTTQRVADTGIYALMLETCPAVRRLQINLSAGGVLILCDNPAYPQQHLTDSQAAKLDILGRVIWVGGDI